MVHPYGYTNFKPPFSSLFANSSLVSLYFLEYLPGLLESASSYFPLAALTNSSLRHPFPINASLGCKYLWKVFRMTESLLTLIPTYSSIALILVFCFCSPPSFIMMTHLPPSSMYLLMSYSSWALKGILGPPNSSIWHSFNFLRVRSLLFISHCSYKIK